MKTEYLYDRGKLTVIDDELGFLNPIPYQDNIEKIFETENLIEQIDEELSLLKNKKNNFEEIAKKNKRITPILFLGFTLPAFLMPFLVTYIFSLIINVEFSTLYIIGDIHFVEFAMSYITPTFTLAGITYSLISFTNYKEYLKKAKGTEKQQTFLKEKLKESEQNLKKLIKDNKKEKEANFILKPTKKINKDNLIELKQLLKLYFNIGFNEEKYIKYYNDGTLYKKIKGKYNEEEVEVIESYISDKVKTLKKEYNG